MEISIIGCGNVGEAVGFLLVNKLTFSARINIMEPDLNKRGKWLELMHIAGLNKMHEVVYNQSEALREADWIFYTAGAGIKIGQDRREVALKNVQLAKDIFLPLQFKKEPTIIVMTNPVDTVTYFIRRFTNLSRSKVIGTGTSIDSARFSSNLYRMGYSKKHVFAPVIGEHGNSMVLLFSQLNFDVPNKELVIKMTKEAALEVKQTQDATYTAVASCALRMMDVIQGEVEDEFMPFNTLTGSFLNEKLELEDAIDISWLYNYNRSCKEKSSFELDKKEWELLRASGQAMLAFQNLIKSKVLNFL